MIKKMRSGRLALLVWAAAASVPATARAADYAIDADHSAVGFRVRHLAISTVPGAFRSFDGVFKFDPAKPAESSVKATIDASSIDTAQKKRDDHLRSPDFFDVAKFPSLKFESRKTIPAGKDAFKVEGDLTMHGVTKPVVLDVKYNGSAMNPMTKKERAAFTATTKLNRKDFGLTWNKVLETGGLVVGDEVDVTIDVEGEKI